MTKLSKRESVLLVLLLIALCGALYYNFILKPYLAKSVDIALKTGEVRVSISDSKAKSAATALLDKSIKDIQDKMGQKFEKVLDSIDRPAIIVMLSKTMRPHASNITLGFPPSYQDLKSNYITTVETTFQSTEDGFQRILTNLETAAYINRVIKASLILTDPEAGICSASVSIEILTSSVLPTKTVLAE